MLLRVMLHLPLAALFCILKTCNCPAPAAGFKRGGELLGTHYHQTTADAMTFALTTSDYAEAHALPSFL